jgi:glutaredoxin
MFIVYSKPNCPACEQAKALLKSKGLAYEELVLDVGQPKVDGVKYITVQELKALLPGVRTVPVIFGPTSQRLVGGLPQLQELLTDF